MLSLLCILIPSTEATTEKYYKEILPNGLQIILDNDSTNQVCSLNIFCKVGSFEETEENMGISHFFEHLFFRGTPSLNGHEFKRAIESIGGVTNATTGQDFTHYYINLPSKHALKGMELLADALKNAEMSEESIDQERKAVLEEYRMNLENPSRIVGNLLNELAYGEHPYSRPVIGTESNIRSFKRQDFLKFRNTFISPERITVVVTGDFSRLEMLELLHKEFDNFNRPSKRLISNFARVKPPAKELVQIKEGPNPISFVVLGYLGPSVQDKPDIYRVDVMSFLLGLGNGSLINKKIVKSSLAREGGIMFNTQRFQGLITLYAVCDAGKEETIKSELLNVIEQVKEGKFSERDLRRAKAFLRSNYLMGLQSASGEAENIGFYSSIDKVEFIDTYLQKIEKVTREEVIDTAKKYFGEGRYCLQLKGQPAKSKNTGREE
ncbi:insulinase family protein [bacterium]|nr:insulinase family protein [bacterium]